MISGLLTDKIMIYKNTIGKNQYGGVTSSLKFLKNMWATVTVKNLSQLDSNDQIKVVGITSFTTRLDNQLNYDCQIFYDDNYYEILTINKNRLNGSVTIDARVILK